MVGGLVSKLTHKDKDKEHEPAHRETTTATHEPVATEKEASHHDKEKSIPIIGGLLAKMGSKDKDKETEHTTTHHDKTVGQSAPVTTESGRDTHADHKREGEALLAGGVAGGVLGDAASKRHEESTAAAAHHDPALAQHSSSTVEPVSAHTGSALPVAGGVTSRHDDLAPTTHNTSTIEPVPVARDVTTGPEESTRSTHRTGTEQEPTSKGGVSSIPLVGGLISRMTSKKEDKEHDTTHHDKITSEREPGTKDKEVGVHDGHGREALAGAAAAAAAAEVARSHKEDREAPLASVSFHNTLERTI